MVLLYKESFPFKEVGVFEYLLQKKTHSFRAYCKGVDYQVQIHYK